MTLIRTLGLDLSAGVCIGPNNHAAIPYACRYLPFPQRRYRYPTYPSLFFILTTRGRRGVRS